MARQRAANSGRKGKKKSTDFDRGIGLVAPLSDPYSARTGSRSEFVYRALLQAIRSGRLRSGDRIREEDIAKSLRVSRTPVREALQLLQNRRLVELAPGRGTTVVELTKQQVMELYAMREVLEGAAARFAAQHASPAEIGLMHQLVSEFSAARGNPPLLASINHALHQSIYHASRNSYVQEALTNLNDTLSLLRNTTFSLPDRHASADRENRTIVAAIEKRDSDAAEVAARRHIREAMRARLRLSVEEPSRV